MGKGVEVGVGLGVGLGVIVGVKVAVAVGVGLANGLGRLATALQDKMAMLRIELNTSIGAMDLR